MLVPSRVPEVATGFHPISDKPTVAAVFQPFSEVKVHRTHDDVIHRQCIGGLVEPNGRRSTLI